MRNWFFLLLSVNLFAQMTGDWKGYRDLAREKGIEITGSYSNDLMGNPVGGKHRGFANAGSLSVFCLLDLEKMFGRFEATSIFSSFCFRHGNNLSATKIGNQFPVQQLFGRETYGLSELYLSKSLLCGLFQFKAGRMCGGNDFFASPLYGKFVNNGFCGNPVSIFFNTLFTAFPFTTWAVYFHVKPVSNFLMKFACYNNNKNIFKDKYHGVYFRFKSTQGVTFITEWVYTLEKRTPGHYKAGAYYVTGRVPKFTGGSRVGNYGTYLLVDQMIYKREATEITPFAALLFAPSAEENKFPFFLTSGMVFKGIIPGREDDNLSLGVVYGSYSHYLRPKESAETVLELNYWAWINSWMVVTPDIQYIINPKGLGTIPNAFVMGMQVIINL